MFFRVAAQQLLVGLVKYTHIHTRTNMSSPCICIVVCVASLCFAPHASEFAASCFHPTPVALALSVFDRRVNWTKRDPGLLNRLRSFTKRHALKWFVSLYSNTRCPKIEIDRGEGVSQGFFFFISSLTLFLVRILIRVVNEMRTKWIDNFLKKTIPIE